MRDFDEVLGRLKGTGAHAIARVVVFKDDVLARHRRGWAVTDGPMAYPSAYHLGIAGHRAPVANPYAVGFETVRRTRERTAVGAVDVRPWIQDFRDDAFDRRACHVAEVVHAQMTAAMHAGATGWMLWNPQNRCTVEALASWPAARR